MPRRRSAPPARPSVKVRLCAALTFDGKLCPPPTLPAADAVGGAWNRLWADLSARSDALLADDDTDLASILPADATPLPVARIRLDLGLHVSACLRELRSARGIKNVLCAGGPALFRALLEQDLADELHLLVRPLVSGAGDQPTLSGPPGGAYFAQSLTWRLHRMEAAGDGECVLEYRRQKAEGGRQKAEGGRRKAEGGRRKG